MMRNWRTAAPLSFLIPALIPLLAGCSSASTDAGASPAATPAATASSQEQFQQMTAEWNQLYVACARKFGANAQVNSDGTISQPYAPGRPTTDGLDADCVKQLGSPPPAPAPSHALLRGSYVLLVQQAACLKKHGYAISQPPPQEVWVDTYSGTSWYPLNDVANSGGDVMSAMRLCPQPDPVAAEKLGQQSG